MKPWPSPLSAPAMGHAPDPQENRMKPQALLLALFLATPLAHAAMTPEVAQLQQKWAEIKYKTPAKQRPEALEKLSTGAEAVAKAQPGAAEPLIWEAIILSTLAGEKGGLGALSLVERARDLLLQAEKIDPKALHGSVYTSLGSLYYQVPGWPVGFGDDSKARTYLQKAIAMDPDGIDANYFYGDFLLEQGNYAEAVQRLEKALAAPPRPGREVADHGRAEEIRAALEKAKRQMN